MKTLFLGTSDDVTDRVPESIRTTTVASERFTQLTATPVDSDIRVIWPGDELPGLVDQWLERYEPGMVVIHVNPYWFTYRSVPARIGRLLGPAGRPLQSAGLRLAEIPAVSESAAFKMARRFAVRTVGGDLAISPQGCVALLGEVIRRIVSHEEIVLMVQGPYRPNDASNTRAGYRRGAAACRTVNLGLRHICERLHVAYWDRGVAPRSGLIDDLFGDAVHVNAAEQARLGRQEGEWMARTWLAAHGPGTAQEVPH